MLKYTVRLFYILFLFGFLFELCGCTLKHHNIKKNIVIQPQVISVMYNLPYYNNIVVCGNFNVELITNNKHHNKVIVRGDRRDLQQVNFVVRGNTLFIAFNYKTYPHYQSVNLQIYIHKLNKFNYKGTGLITGNNIYSNYLDININNNGKTQLNGKVNLHTVIINGNGIFSLYWVKSHDLIIKEFGNATLLLAGIANKLDLELWNKSRFNGRYLRVEEVFVKTHDDAIAGINALHKQHTLASDASDIYFYNLSTMRNDLMAYTGAVLDMRDWQLFDAQEYTKYNK